MKKSEVRFSWAPSIEKPFKSYILFSDEKYQEKSIIAPLANQAKFHYDSSDTDDDAEDKKAVIKKATDTTANQAPLKGGKYSKTGVWRQNFFIRADDERLKGKIYLKNCLVTDIFYKSLI